jgi:drug/metabolite transporter (DMT)-like permease
MRDHTRGMLLMVAGVLVVSPNALLIQLAGRSAPPLTTLMWRQVAITVVQFVLCCGVYRGVGAVLRSGWQSGSYFWAAVPLYVHADLSLFTRSQRHECERRSLRLHRSNTTTRNVHALRFSQPHSHALTHVHAQRRHCRHRYAAGSTCVILSFQMTSAANALVLFTLQPLWATLGSLLYFHDPMPPRKVLAVLVGLVAAVLVFIGERLDTSGSPTDHHASSIGDVLALAGGLGFAGYFMVCRACALAGAGSHLLPTAIGGQFFAALVALVLVIARHAPGTPTCDEFWAWIGLDGLVGASLLLTTCAMRHIIPPENAIVGLLEMVLGPLWVYVVIGEEPLVWTVVAGFVLLVTIALHEYFELHEYHANKRLKIASHHSGDIWPDSIAAATSLSATSTSSAPAMLNIIYSRVSVV